MEPSLIDNYDPKEDIKPWNMDINTFCMLMHLSQFASSVLPLAGLILPLVMWLQFRKENRKIDENGKEIMNFMLTMLIAGIGFVFVFVLLFVGVLAGSSGNPFISISSGILFLLLAIGLAIGYLVVIILAAVNANKGEIGRYPMTIKFFKPDGE